MKVEACMTKNVVSVSYHEPASVAARLMSRWNVGLLPVRGQAGRLVGVVTDRDIALRCAAADRDPKRTSVGEIMTSRVAAVAPDAELESAVRLFGREQVRRLPVVEDGRLLGIVSLADLARREDYSLEAAECLSAISAGVCRL